MHVAMAAVPPPQHLSDYRTLTALRLHNGWGHSPENVIPHSCGRSDSIPSLLVLEVMSQVVPPQLVEHRPLGRDSKVQPKVSNIVGDVPKEASTINGHKGWVGEHEREGGNHCH